MDNKKYLKFLLYKLTGNFLIEKLECIDAKLILHLLVLRHDTIYTIACIGFVSTFSCIYP